MDLHRLAKSSVLAGLFLSLSTPFSCRRNDMIAPAVTCGAEAPAPAAAVAACEADADCNTDEAPNIAFACLDPGLGPRESALSGAP